jgi:toxin ParE1/3/4
MNASVTQRPRARLDLLEQFVYFGEQAGVELAERYLEAVEQTCLQLVRTPQIGREYDATIPRLEGIRRFPVSGFEQYLIFYLPQQDGMEVIRVLHGARDIAGIFAEREA